MLSLKAGVLALFLSFALNGVDSCDGKKSGGAQNSNQSVNASAPANRQPEKPDAGTVKDDMKQLAQGQNSLVRNAFIAVARDAETYGALRKVASSLPELGQDFFQSNLVVAAFLGERQTGGYGARITRAGAETIRVEETPPPKDAMVTQAITYPFSAVAVPVNNQSALSLDAGNAWNAMTSTYRVMSGEFTMSGGITGRRETFGITGRLSIAREGNLATLFLSLKSIGGKKERWLKAVASGFVNTDRKITFPNFSPGSFVDQPSDMLSANLYFSANDRRISLSFDSVPSPVVRDGFNGSGALVAESNGPTPPKKKASTEDAP
jgi:hypothetical protein